MQATYIKVGKQQGLMCDRCGTYIENIYQFESSGNRINVGSECINKVINVNEFGMKLLKKELNFIKRMRKDIEVLQSGNEEKIKKLNYTGSDAEGWIRTLTARISIAEKDISKKFKNIPFLTEDK